MAFLVFILHLALTWFMAGVIWIVQLVHYPLFEEIAAENFARFSRSHQSRITWIVAPVMILEVCTGLFLIWPGTAYLSMKAAALNFIAIVAIWLSTLFLQVPIHQKFLTSFDKTEHSRLLHTNWARTLLWTLRALLLLTAAMKLEWSTL